MIIPKELFFSIALISRYQVAKFSGNSAAIRCVRSKRKIVREWSTFGDDTRDVYLVTNTG